MEKRTLTAFFLILVFFLIWAQFAPQETTQPIGEEGVKREIVSVQEEKPASPPSSLGMSLPEEAGGLEELQIANYYLTLSQRGGYIHSIALGSPDNILPFRNIGFQPATQNIDYQIEAAANSILFTTRGHPGKQFVFHEDLLEISNLDNSPILLFSFLTDTGSNYLSQRYYESFYYTGNKLYRAHPKRIKEEALKGVEFAGARSQYYAISLLKGKHDIEWVKTEAAVNLYLKRPYPAASLYIGPQIVKNLSPYGLEGIVYYGFWHFLALGIIRVLYFFHGFLNNWGLSIIFFSLFAHLILFPLTSKSTKALRKMQEVQPLMQEIREKYKKDPQKMQKETIELYRRHKVNPMGGCLPMLFQFPIIIAFYQIVFRFPEIKGASFLWIKDLAMPDQLFRLPFIIPIVRVEYFNLLPILVMVLGILQQNITTSSTNPQQKKIGLFMGVFIGAIFYKFPSGLVLYWLIQNLLTFIYQFRLQKASTAGKTA